MGTVKLEVDVKDFEEVSEILQACNFKIMALNFGCDDGDYVETFPEDRGDDFDPTEYEWIVS